MANWQWFGRLHAKVLTATGGRIGSRLVGLEMLLLTTKGRRSGLRRTTPMPFYRDGETLVLVGSNGGQPQDPAWLHNLRACPEAEVAIRGQSHHVEARLATPVERARLWPTLKQWNKNYQRYERKTDRELPVVLLTPRPTR